MKLYLGTTSETKIAIIKEGIEALKPYELIPVEVDSGISDQPLDEATTMRGAENRARRAAAGKQFDLSIGLEGGLVMQDGLYHLVCAVALMDPSSAVFFGISRKLPLPPEVSERIVGGEQFGSAIREFQGKMSEEHSPEMYELVEELISRRKSFHEAFTAALFKFRGKENIF